MDFLQNWGPHAPRLLSFWISIACIVAYVRVRKNYTSDIAAAQLTTAVLALSQSVWFIPGFGDNLSTLDWVTLCLRFVWPLILLGICVPFGKRRQTWPYRHPIEVLLFRKPQAPVTEQSVPASLPSQPPQSYTFATIGLIALAALLGGISYLGVGLQTCEWLDVALKRSGCLRSLQVDRESIEDVAFSPDGRLLAVASSEATIQVYRVDDGRLQQTLRGHSDWVNSVAFSPDGTLIASGSWDGTVRFWDSVSGTLKQTLSAPDSPGRQTIHIAFSPDGTLLASADDETPAHLWRVSDGALLRTIPNTGESVAFSPDGSMVATEGLSNTIVLSRISDGSTVETLGGQDVYVRNLAFSPDGAILASGGGDAIRLWRVSDGTLIQTFSTQADWDLAFSPDGQLIVSGGTNDDIQNSRGYMELWRVATGQRLSQRDAGRFSIRNVAFSPTGKTIASASGFETVRLWSP